MRGEGGDEIAEEKQETKQREMLRFLSVWIQLYLLVVAFPPSGSWKVLRAYALHGSSGTQGCIEYSRVNAEEVEEGDVFFKHSSGLFLPSNWNRATEGDLRSSFVLSGVS